VPLLLHRQPGRLVLLWNVSGRGMGGRGGGGGKTEAVAFIPGATQPAVLPPLRVLGTQLHVHVAWEE